MVSRAEVNYNFTDAELDELRAFGTVESHKAGDLLVEEYDPEKDSAAVTLTFDSAGASAATTEKFKRDSHGKKWLDTNVIFDGRYVRQKSVFETR